MTHIEEEFQKIESENGWNMLFRRLANEHGSLTFNKKHDVALSSMNRGLNRFRDVLPYNDTRVKLQDGPNDYINANYVRVPSANRTYILTQGPLPNTSEHFWQMVWEQNSRVIIMLTHLVEKGSNKCWLYYPDYENESELIYDDVSLKVTYVSERPESHYTQRRFELMNLSTGETRSIIHWSDFDWPDHGAPNTPEAFLELLCDVRQSGAFDVRYGPPIIHCSAGIGRSGTFVLVDSILKMLAHAENPSSICLTEVLAEIRKQRHGLIQTPEQLRFSYLAVVAGMKELDEIEKFEDSFHESDFDASSESDEDENLSMSSSLHNADQEVVKRAVSTASSHRWQQTTNDVETSLRLRDERLRRNEGIKKKVEGIKAKLDDKSSDAATPMSISRMYNGRIVALITKYRRYFFFGMLTLVTGSMFLYKFVKINERTH